tara:strand:+ start:401 stop:691 length:291 start_codon:yes stop_codon:yes gene_type:complete
MIAKLRVCVAILCLVICFHLSVGTIYSAFDGTTATYPIQQQDAIPVPTPQTLFEDVENLPEPDYRVRYFAAATGTLFVILISTVAILSYRRHQTNN